MKRITAGSVGMLATVLTSAALATAAIAATTTPGSAIMPGTAAHVADPAPPVAATPSGTSATAPSKTPNRPKAPTSPHGTKPGAPGRPGKPGKPGKAATPGQDPAADASPIAGISTQSPPMMDLPQGATVKLSGKELEKLRQLKAKLDEIIKIHSQPAAVTQPKIDVTKDHGRAKFLALVKSMDDAVTRILAKAEASAQAKAQAKPQANPAAPVAVPGSATTDDATDK
jgi:hypothetical protein